MKLGYVMAIWSLLMYLTGLYLGARFGFFGWEPTWPS